MDLKTVEELEWKADRSEGVDQGLESNLVMRAVEALACLPAATEQHHLQ